MVVETHFKAGRAHSDIKQIFMTKSHSFTSNELRYLLFARLFYHTWGLLFIKDSNLKLMGRMLLVNSRHSFAASLNASNSASRRWILVSERHPWLMAMWIHQCAGKKKGEGSKGPEQVWRFSPSAHL